jgi:hypothetical protein
MFDSSSKSKDSFSSISSNDSTMFGIEIDGKFNKDSLTLGMGHRTQTSMFNIGVDIGSDHRWVGNIEQKTSIF